jgi:hypothetical protein
LIAPLCTVIESPHVVSFHKALTQLCIIGSQWNDGTSFHEDTAALSD